MYDAWSIVGVGGGSAALTYLASNWRDTANGETTLRLSLDKSGSLLGDVRFLGGGLAWLASMYTGGTTKRTLETVAAASLFSLAQTEIIRMRLAQKQGPVRIAGSLPLAPSYSFGALPAPNARQGAWATR